MLLNNDMDDRRTPFYPSEASVEDTYADLGISSTVISDAQLTETIPYDSLEIDALSTSEEEPMLDNLDETKQWIYDLDACQT